jgi:hypothetical protein
MKLMEMDIRGVEIGNMKVIQKVWKSLERVQKAIQGVQKYIIQVVRKVKQEIQKDGQRVVPAIAWAGKEQLPILHKAPEPPETEYPWIWVA